MKILTNPKHLNALQQVLQNVEVTSNPFEVTSPVAIVWDTDTDTFLKLLQNMNVPPDFVILTSDENGLEPVDFEQIEPLQLRMERTEDLLDDPFAVNAPADVYDAFARIVNEKMNIRNERQKQYLAHIRKTIERFIGLEIPDENLLVSAVASYAGVSKDEALLALNEYTTINQSRTLVWRQDV